MSFYLKFGGAALVMIGSVWLSRAYERHTQKRLLEYSGLVALLEHMERKISGFLAYGEELWCDFRDDAMEKCGLLARLRSGESLFQAFGEASENMSLSRTERESVGESLAQLGRAELDSELKLLSRVREEISSRLLKIGAESEKNIKITRALLLGGALAAVILIL